MKSVFDNPYGKNEPLNIWGKLDEYGSFLNIDGEENEVEEDQLLKSGYYKFKWHNCNKRSGTIEWKGDGSSSGWFISGFDISTGDYVSGTFRSSSPRKYSDPCTELPDDAKFSKNDILNPDRYSIWNHYDIYIPPVCSDLEFLGSHCNCGGTPDTHEYWKKEGISSTEGLSKEVSSSLRTEIQTGIKATANVGIPFIGGTDVELSTQLSVAVGISSSILRSASITKSRETTRKIKTDTPGGKCTTFYQAIVYYGEFAVAGTTYKKEKTAPCKRK